MKKDFYLLQLIAFVSGQCVVLVCAWLSVNFLLIVKTSAHRFSLDVNRERILHIISGKSAKLNLNTNYQNDTFFTWEEPLSSDKPFILDYEIWTYLVNGEINSHLSLFLLYFASCLYIFILIFGLLRCVTWFGGGVWVVGFFCPT